MKDQIVETALEQAELAPREQPVRFTDEGCFLVSEVNVHSLLDERDLITGLSHLVADLVDRTPHSVSPIARNQRAFARSQCSRI